MARARGGYEATTPVEEIRQPGAAAVSGELVEAPEAAVIPSDAEQNAGADRARGRTAVQVTIPSALVIIFDWLCALAGLDLDPWSTGTGLPASINVAMTALATVALAFRMNPKR